MAANYHPRQQKTSTNYTSLLEEELKRLNKEHGWAFSVEDTYTKSGPDHCPIFLCNLKLLNAGKQIANYQGGHSQNFFCKTKSEGRNQASKYAYSEIRNPQHKIWETAKLSMDKKLSSPTVSSAPNHQIVTKDQKQSKMSVISNSSRVNHHSSLSSSSPEFHPQFYESPIDFSLKKFGTLSVFIDNTNGEEMTGKAVTQSLVEKKRIYYYPQNRFGIENTISPNLKNDNSFNFSDAIIVIYNYDIDIHLITKFKEMGNHVYIHATDKEMQGLVNIADKIVK